MPVIPPATLEGWYALHQTHELRWDVLRGEERAARRQLAEQAAQMASAWAAPEGGGWSRAFRLAGGGADLLWVHFRPTLDALADVQAELQASPLGAVLRRGYDYLSVTEAGLYYATSKVAEEAEPHSDEFQRLLRERMDEEAATPHLQTRLYPEVPEGMRYASFYPMSKRRAHPDNWYTLPIAERNRLMREHGLTGRRYAGRVFQVITGSVGLDDWEWGVTLFARDPLEFKRIVTEMRYDEASSRYGEFGRFFTGIELDPDGWLGLLDAVRESEA